MILNPDKRRPELIKYKLADLIKAVIKYMASPNLCTINFSKTFSSSF